MVATNGLKSFPEKYAENSDYVHKTYAAYQQAASENYDAGFEPLQTLPATWFNSLFYLLTEQAQATKELCDSIFAEIQSILTAAEVTPNPAYTNQLLTAIERITALQIATGSVLGGIKSSNVAWNVSVNGSTGIASVNTVDASTSAKGLVQLDDTLNSVSTTKAPTAANLAAAFARGIDRGSCSTGASTTTKVVNDVSNFSLEEGAMIAVTFANANTAADATLNVNSTGAYTIKLGANSTRGGNYQTWKAGEVVLFEYTSSQWQMIANHSITLSGSTMYIEA